MYSSNRRFLNRRLTGAIVLVLVAASGGCELILDFDRTKIAAVPTDGSTADGTLPEEDAMSNPDVVTTMDTGADTNVDPDANMQPDTSTDPDTGPPDTGTDAGNLDAADADDAG